MVFAALLIIHLLLYRKFFRHIDRNPNPQGREPCEPGREGGSIPGRSHRDKVLPVQDLPVQLYPHANFLHRTILIQRDFRCQ
jgi:hypothetical protein